MDKLRNVVNTNWSSKPSTFLKELHLKTRVVLQVPITNWLSASSWLISHLTILKVLSRFGAKTLDFFITHFSFEPQCKKHSNKWHVCLLHLMCHPTLQGVTSKWAANLHSKASIHDT